MWIHSTLQLLLQCDGQGRILPRHGPWEQGIAVPGGVTGEASGASAGGNGISLAGANPGEITRDISSMKQRREQAFELYIVIV